VGESGHEFPSEAWCRRAIALFNEDPQAADAARGWDGDFGVVFDRPDGPLAVWVGPPQEGRLPAPEFLSLEALERRAPRYFARATVPDWRALMTGALDPVGAIVQKRLVARGDLTPVIARLGYRGLALRWLARIESTVSTGEERP
jgi:hypothetical protein